ncbi:hypothetical protein ADEAN_000591600 [Angomonas deanei]|uniref:Uncharacterized protein n=1 Tax=Angomonas deanei TaxID=59799 RepID=A0A7G2CEU1_9TRYP|nr:hypothetical protein ADEAN_000591600 [Angomonas deanei]
MSCVLFCGGAIIPPGAGITMSTLPAPLRSAGAAFAQTMYNLLGNYSGPLLCGFIAKQTGHLKYGIYTLFLCSLLGVVPMSFIVLIAWRRKQSGVTADTVVVMDTIEEEGGGGVDQEMAHVPPAGGSFSVRKENKEEVLPFSRTTQKVSPLESWRRGQERPARLASPPGSVAVEPSAAPTPLHTPKDSGLRTRESFLGMLDGSQEKSIPNQHAFGMDLVYSWLTAQEETERRRTASVAGRTNLHPLQADSVEMSPSVDSESRRRKNHNSRE